MSGEAVTIELKSVTKSYGSKRHPVSALAPVSLQISSASRVGIIGESGSGKSTLSKLAVGLETPTAGMVEVDGRSVEALLRSRTGRIEFRRKAQYIAQDTTSSFDPRHKLIRSIVDPARRLRGLSMRDAQEEALRVMDLLALPRKLADRYPHQVSGGQRQRFAIARSFVVQPRVLLCDEVVSALDVSVQGAVLNTLKAYCEQHDAGLIFVSHGIPATAFIADELIVMRSGKIVEQGPTDQIINDPQHPYTQFLLESHRSGLDAGKKVDR